MSYKTLNRSKLFNKEYNSQKCTAPGPAQGFSLFKREFSLACPGFRLWVSVKCLEMILIVTDTL